MKQNKVKSTPALCAQAIRADLKLAFPGTTFTVKSESFAGGNAVNIGYLDGPLCDDVEAVVSKYQYGHFDGRTDSYEHSNKIEGLPQVRFVSVTRRPSETTKELIAAELGITDENRNDWFEADHCYQYERIYRTFVQRDYSPKDDLVIQVIEQAAQVVANVIKRVKAVTDQVTENDQKFEAVPVKVEGVLYVAQGAKVCVTDKIYGVSDRWNLYSATPDPRTNQGEVGYLLKWADTGAFTFWLVSDTTRSVLSASSVVFIKPDPDDNTPGPDDNTPGPGNTIETLVPIEDEDEGDEMPGVTPGVTLSITKTGPEVDLVTELFDKEPGNARPVSGKDVASLGGKFHLAINQVLNGEPDEQFPTLKVEYIRTGTGTFENRPDDRERLLSGSWVDTSVKYPNNVTFDQVYEKYPDGQILRVSEYLVNDTWHPITDFFNSIEAEIWSPAETIQRLIDCQGATAFCIEIEDRFGRVKNPDFRTDELLPW